MSLIFWLVFTAFAQAQTPTSDIYTEKIQPLFNHRCIACHSCLNSPCQLNLQSYEGFQRGAHQKNVYNGTRIDAVEPTRLWLDAHSTEEWRDKGFFSVQTSSQPAENLFFRTISLKASEKKFPRQKPAESRVCASTVKEQKIAMPYALPGLSTDETKTLETWIRQGAPGPHAAAALEAHTIPTFARPQVQEWEKFFNKRDLRHQLVSRYLYEHLFLAHFYFPEEPQTFFNLVRSGTPCTKKISVISTRRPNDNPGVEKFFYCLQKQPGTVVSKNHIPYELSPAKKKRLEEIFFQKKWKALRLPSYNFQTAENPFLAFQDIPVKARYEFLLEDAQFHVSTFIKGPVCNGSNAVNSIQEQFYVFFINPKSELMNLSQGFSDQATPLLMLPGVWGSNVKLDSTPKLTEKLVKHREAYRSLRARWKKELFPTGYALNDIWAGDGHNPNAVLTIFRHDDNAAVLQGAVGDLSKTLFVLDYPLFERLVYNLVVNFDVFGNVGHQFLTRIYMDMIRMEAEEIFLSFLPPSQRISMRKEWYQGFMTDLKMTYVYPILNPDLPTAIPFVAHQDSKKQWVEKVLFLLMNEKVRGPLDVLNWKQLQIPESLAKSPPVDKNAETLRPLASVSAGKKTPFARFFPDIALLQVTSENGTSRVYSFIHHREHQNISWILAESLRMSPQEDSLTIREGFWGPYPNMFFTVAEKNLASFVQQAAKIKSEKDYRHLVQSFGVPRTQKRFWGVYDELHQIFRETHPTEFGYLDLTRYEMEF